MKRPHRHFLTDAAVYGIGGVLIQLGGIALLPLYTHFLSPADYGVMEIVERIGQIITICLMTTGVRQAAFAFYLQAPSQADRERVATTITLFLTAIFALAGLAVVALSPIIAPMYKIDNPALLSFGVISALAELFMVIPLSLMQARVESIRYVFITLGMLIVRVGLAVLFVAKFHWGVWGVYGSLIITFLGFGWPLTARELRRGSLRVDWNKFWEIAHFSLPFIPTGICTFVLYNGDRFILAEKATLEDVGIYGLGCRIASFATTIAWQPLFSVWSARMYKTFETPEAPRVAGQMLTRSLTFYSFVALGMCLFHREMLIVLAKPEYAAAGPVIAPMLLANGFMLAAGFMEGVFYVFRKTHWKPWTSLAGMLINVGLYWLLIPRYFVFGAVYGTLIGYAAVAVMTYFIAQRVFAVRYEWGKVLSLLACSAGVAFVGSCLPLGVAAFALKSALVLVWMFVICATRIVSPEDQLIVKQRLYSLAAKLRLLLTHRSTVVEASESEMDLIPSCDESEDVVAGRT